MSYGQGPGADVFGSATGPAAMAGGGGGPAFGLGPGPGRPQPWWQKTPARLALGAAVVVALLLAVVVVRGGSDDGSSGNDDGSELSGQEEIDSTRYLLQALSTFQLVRALQDERNAAVMDRIGASDLVDLPETEPVDLRGRTDQALADLRRRLPGEPVGGAQQDLFDELDRLADVRAEIDAYTGPTNMDQIDAAIGLFDSYRLAVARALDVVDALGWSPDDPAARTTVEVHRLAFRLSVDEDQLVLSSVLGSLGSGTTSEALSRQAEVFATTQADRAAITTAAAGSPYEAAVARALDDTVPMMDAAETALTGQYDVAIIIDGASGAADEGWRAVEQQAADELDALD